MAVRLVSALAVKASKLPRVRPPELIGSFSLAKPSFAAGRASDCEATLLPSVILMIRVRTPGAGLGAAAAGHKEATTDPFGYPASAGFGRFAPLFGLFTPSLVSLLLAGQV